jgi:aquaporin Z
MKALVVELLGTFLFVFSIALAVKNAGPLAPIPIGLALCVLVYMGGWISGGHYNPAVSLAAAIRGALPMPKLLPYMGVQLGGAFLAALLARAVSGEAFVPAPGPTASTMQALVVEIVFTFMLCMVVLMTATVKKTAGNSYYGAAIGLTIVVAAFAGGSISGGAYNPAVGIGPLLASAVRGGPGLGHWWLYAAGPLAGGAAAGLLFQFLAGEES